MNRKTLWVLILISAGISMGMANIKLDNMTWFDLEFNDGSDSSLPSFFIGRNYFTLKGDLSDGLKARITFDLAKSTLFKYAYIDWNFAKGFGFVIGLQKVKVGYLPKWEYPLPEKNIVELIHGSTSADAGFTIYVKPISIMKIELQLLNGEGYSHPFEKVDLNTNYAFVGNVEIQSSKLFSAGMSVKYNGDERMSTYDIYL